MFPEKVTSGAASPNGASAVQDLIDQLLAESFAVANNFATLSLDQVGEILEQAQTEMANLSGEPSDVQNAIDSFERCKLSYCTLLLELETGHLEVEKAGTLWDMRFQSEAASPQPEPLPLPPAEDASSLSVVDADESFMKPVAPPPIPVPVMPPLEDVIEPMALEALAPPVEHNEGTMVADISDLDLTAIPTPPPLEPAPMNETPEEEPSESSFTFSDILSPVSTQRAQDFWRLSEYFRSLRNSKQFPFEEGYIDRLVGQNYCFAVEAECHERLIPKLEKFWPTRQAAINALVDTKSQKFELQPVLKAAINQLAESHLDWLFEAKFPHPGILNSLRYILASHELKKFKPTLLDIGVLFFLFGQEGTLGGFPLHNRLDVLELERDEVTEIAFKLFRIQKLRNRCIAVAPELNSSHLEVLKDDVLRVLTLLKRAEFKED